MSNQVKIARTAKGKKPQYFSDPAVDKLLAIVLSLVGELSVTRERLDTVERILQDKGLIVQSDIDDVRLSQQAQTQRAEKRSLYLQRVLRAVQMELEETVGEDMPASFDDVLRQMT
jgi:hypothetical protein